VCVPYNSIRRKVFSANQLFVRFALETPVAARHVTDAAKAAYPSYSRRSSTQDGEAMKKIEAIIAFVQAREVKLLH